MGALSQLQVEHAHAAHIVVPEPRTEPGRSRRTSTNPTKTSQNILLVGSGSRAGLSNKQLAQVGTAASPGYATDTILLVHIPGDGSKATVVSFPRDSYVDIPGSGTNTFSKNKINAAYSDGACYSNGNSVPDCSGALSVSQQAAGMRELIATVSKLSGLHIDHFAEVGLYGFYQISEAIGGVQLRNIAAGNVIFETVPVANASAQTASGEDVVELDMAKMPGFFAHVIGTPRPGSHRSSSTSTAGQAASAVPRSKVSVRVLNAAGVALLATHSSDTLHRMGFTIAGTGNAQPRTQTEIHYSATQAAQARTLANTVPGAKLVADDSAGTSSVTLTLGSSFQPGSLGPSPSSTTSSAPTSSSSIPAVQRTAADNSCIN